MAVVSFWYIQRSHQKPTWNGKIVILMRQLWFPKYFRNLVKKHVQTFKTHVTDQVMPKAS